MAVIPVFSVIIYSEISKRSEAVTSAKEDVQIFLHSFSEVQNNITGTTRTLLHTIAALPEIQHGTPEAARMVLSTLLKANPIYTNAILVDLNGKVIAMGKGKDKGFNFSDRKQFKDAVSSKRFSSGEFVIGKATSKAIFPFGMPVLDSSGNLLSVIIIGINLNHYQKIFHQEQFPKGTFFGACDHNGMRIFRQPTTDKTPLGQPIKAQVFATVLKIGKPDVFTALTSDGLERIIAFEPLKISPESKPYMYIFIGLDKQALVSEADASLIQGIIASVLSVIIAFTSAWLLGHKVLVEGIERLNMAVKEFGAQGVKIPSGVSYNDGEIGQLAHSFDKMTDTLLSREKELSQSEERLRTTLTAVNDGVWDWRVDVGAVYFSPRWYTMLGYEPGELDATERTFIDLVHPKDVFKVNTAIENDLFQGKDYSIEFRMRAKDGTWRWTHSRGKAVEYDNLGHPTRLIGTHTDITKRRQVEEMVLQNEKMITVGHMVSGVAHEINNPLAGVLGNVQNIKRRAFTSHPANLKAAEECGVSLDKIQQYLEKRKIPSLVNSIYESGERAATIVRNMLGFSRKSSHRYTYESFPDLLEESIELVANDFNPNSDYDFKKIKIERHFAKDLQDVYCERNEIQQVLVNLLKNSADAMSERKSETETPSLTLRLSQDETTCTIEIEDNGPGMDRETRDRIFEPFYTTKSPGKGTGLGLYVSYTIIKEQHGGSIEVTESAKSGTRFIIKLPLQGHSAK